MVETFQAQYVSLHVRESNVAALRLYRDTLQFRVEKTEAKYYADGEDAFSMKQDLAYIREQRALEDGVQSEEDEGEAVGDEGKMGEGVENGVVVEDGKASEAGEREELKTKEKDQEKKKLGDKDVGKKRKVKVGRALGVGELIERTEVRGG